MQWWVPRKVRNKQWKALHGNVKVVVANIGALSNLRLAVRTDPDVVVVQELRASKEAVEKAAKELGLVAACAKGDEVLAAVLFRPGFGQQLVVECAGEFGKRVAAAVISLGGGCGMCVASVYGITSPTMEQKEQLSQAVMAVVGTMRELGRGSCLVGGDFNAEEHEVGSLMELKRAGWADWGSEATCVTAGTKRPRRIDQAWLSPELQARLQGTTLSWAEGLKVHAWQQGCFRGGLADTFPQWVAGDDGPDEEEQGFTDEEFGRCWAGNEAAWERSVRMGSVDEMWELLEGVLVKCHQLRKESFQKPVALTKMGSEDLGGISTPERPSRRSTPRHR